MVFPKDDTRADTPLNRSAHAQRACAIDQPNNMTTHAPQYTCSAPPGHFEYLRASISTYRTRTYTDWHVHVTPVDVDRPATRSLLHADP